MADQVLDFPTSVTNPPEFDYKVTGTLPAGGFATGSFHITGALAGVKVLDKTGKACGTQTVVAREVIKLATITIGFPACPDPAGPLVVTGHVSVPIAPPLGTVFKTNIVITDDASGKVISCEEIDVGGGSAAPTALTATSCCPAGGCDLAGETLSFPSSTPNPVAFDFSVAGTLPATVPATAPKYSFVGKIGASSGPAVKIANVNGPACGAQVVKLSYLSVDIGTTTINFPACPYPAGATKIGGTVATNIGLPDSTVFDAHIEVTDDNGGIGSCIDVHIVPGDGPAPPAPAPPASSTYVCQGGQCVAAAGGVPKATCLAAC